MAYMALFAPFFPRQRNSGDNPKTGKRPAVRQVCVLLHRYVGLATALFLFVVGLTGALLAYYHPLSAWLSPELYHAPGRGPVLQPAELAARAQAAEPRAKFEGYPLDFAAGKGVSFFVTGRTDPATGQPFNLGYDSL